MVHERLPGAQEELVQLVTKPERGERAPCRRQGSLVAVRVEGKGHPRGGPPRVLAHDPAQQFLACRRDGVPFAFEGKAGLGEIGAEPFRRLLAHPKLQKKVFISETPVEEEGDDQRNLDTLKRLAPLR